VSESLQHIDQVLDTLFTHGPVWVYLAVGLACVVENFFPPFPGDTFIVGAGALVGLGRLDLIPTMLVINVCGLSAVMTLFYLGRRYGRAYFIRKDFRFFGAADIKKTEHTFDRWGWLILVASRFVPGVRSALAIVAGLGGYRPPLMLIFSAISYLAFSSLLVYLAMRLAENRQLVESYIEQYNQFVWPVVVLALVMMLGLKILRMRKERRT